ncbi:prepilin peptidase [Candidatus Uhrbacteria bacterium]|nr:prepilin peptidase [Candidatus Uhrbacteria bacterium]
MGEIIAYLLLAFVLGVVTGSIVNATVLRTKAGLPLMSRAKCLSCVEPLAWFDLIPVVSFFALKGRCRRCSSAIEWQYPAVELAMGLLFALFAARIFLGVGIPPYITGTEHALLFIRDAIVAVFLVIIFLYDFRFSVIPDRFSIPAVIIVILANLVLGASTWSLLLGGLALGGFFSVQYLVSQGRWVGGGDIRMGLLMGFLLGLPLGIVALFWSYVLGAIAGVILIAFGHRKLDSHVPFGTFLALATVIVMVFGPWMLDWYLGVLS